MGDQDLRQGEPEAESGLSDDAEGHIKRFVRVVDTDEPPSDDAEGHIKKFVRVVDTDEPPSDDTEGHAARSR